MKEISVIIPCYNEAENIAKLLPLPCETIISVASEKDNTIPVAKKNKAILVISKKPRSKQLNDGVKKAKGEILLFLHADVKPPENFCEEILKAVNKGYEAGCFKIKHDNKSLFYKIMDFLANKRARLGLYYGDQMIWCKKKVYEEIGGFAEEPLLEDVIFSKKLRKYKTIVIPKKATASARKFETNGRIKQLLTNQKIIIKYFLGKEIKELAREYNNKKTKII